MTIPPVLSRLAEALGIPEDSFTIVEPSKASRLRRLEHEARLAGGRRDWDECDRIDAEIEWLKAK